ncbi:bifunctional enoyl-CoA hydratase/phosphate acetyltransferase [Alkalilimnicola sp. S0819]|uniref:bifunctional enoyl-CoA hydratase/phosphate acetyltransferase n=1 Tax=Alkalilimnicola sp. S0819 TaxID=2613922 RepID=UPI0012629506|nr:bifunctional enoyl-CoA hydratase/phosphate acetyltransferase [Alkalilimnicola sp. S0819]KAB7622981.1 bifunctional enoyl-CoA hydratase/phosphate acetyltransferase [Alkalilimnicola sp. S0819]MPQ17090.1 bifunctional enoyl-CoA hydratase/phosphate acetyltransferase [Alkalilimnicola sp. S0819]
MSYIENYPYDELQPGYSAELTARLTLDELRRLATRAAALNPGHMDEQYAGSDLFYQGISPTLWGGALLTTLIASELPGPGTEFLQEDLRYLRPFQLGESVTAEVRVREKNGGREVLLDCLCRGEDGEELVSGTIRVRAPAEKLRRAREARNGQTGRGRQLHRLLERARELSPARTAVVHPVDHHSFMGAIEAAREGLIVPILVGPEAKIRAVAEQEGVDLADVELMDVEHSHQAAEKGVELCRAGEAEILMKGALHTDELMRAVLFKERGLRTARRMSHVWCMDVPSYPRPLFITDSALNIYPDLMTKADITQNAIELCHVLGIERPKVAILSATESVNPAIPSTLDAAALCKMADRGQITGGLLDGPLAFDNAISEAAARTKGIRSEVAGRADILLAPDLEAANMLGKQLHYLADAEAAGIVLGARVPIVLTSRADDAMSRMAACAIALLLADERSRKLELSA